jgi:hypothetical protein
VAPFVEGMEDPRLMWDTLYERFNAARHNIGRTTILRLFQSARPIPGELIASVTGYGGNPRYSRDTGCKILRCWVQTVAGAKILGAKTALPTINRDSRDKGRSLLVILFPHPFHERQKLRQSQETSTKIGNFDNARHLREL